MPITYHITDNIHEFTGEFSLSYDKWEKIADKIEKNFKYGNCVFETYNKKHIFFLAMNGEDIIGILKFKIGGSESFSNPGFSNWVGFMEVNKKYRNKGISKKLIEMLFEYCAKNNRNILASGFTVLGHMCLMKKYIELANKYNVEFSYKDCVEFPDFNNFEGMDEDEYKKYYDDHKNNWEIRNTIINKK